MIAWLQGWAATLHIWLYDRQTYRLLRDLGDFNPDDFVEAGRPE